MHAHTPPPVIRVMFAGEEFSRGYPLTVKAAQDLINHVNQAGKNPTGSTIEVVKCSREQMVEEAPKCHVLVPLMSRIDEKVLESGAKGNLKLVMQFGVGLEGVDVAAATRLGILVTNIPSAPSGNALSVAEHALYLLFAVLRDQHGMDRCIKTKVLGQPLGRTLYGSTVLIIGFGNIARELVPRLKVFGVKLIAARRSPWDLPPSPIVAPEMSEGDSTPVTAVAPRLPTPASNLLNVPAFKTVIASRAATVESHNNIPLPPDPQHMLDERHPWSAIPDLLPRADVVILTCNLTPETRGMVNSEFYAKAKDGFALINVARGGLLDHAATLAALESGKLLGLGADVWWSEPLDPEDPIAKHEKVIVTPHIGGVTEVSYENMSRKLIEESWKVVGKGEKPTVRINDV